MPRAWLVGRLCLVLAIAKVAHGDNLVTLAHVVDPV
jgi:hypothetical protein